MGFLWAAISIAALSCNPAKKALKQKELIDKAIAEWVLDNPPPVTEVFLPGDTILVIDTLENWVTDTLHQSDTIVLTKWRTKIVTNKVVDTLIRTISNNEPIRKLTQENAILQDRLMRSEAKKENYILFLILLGILFSVLLFTKLK